MVDDRLGRKSAGTPAASPLIFRREAVGQLSCMAQRVRFPHRHLLGIEGLSPFDIEALLDRADEQVEVSRQVEKKKTTLRGRTQINLFFEPSTRTQSSFEIAGKRLGADVMNMSVASSSVKKGETLIDTAMTLNAMRPDIIVVRHHAAGAVHLLAQKVDCSVVNAGDGAHEHPTQALLDALTIRRNKGRIEGLVVAICGDILHSRVARSNIILLQALGARVRVVAPSTLLPPGIERFGVEAFTDMREGLAGADIVMMLRLQRERMNGSFVPSREGVFPLFRPRPGEARRCAKPDALVMHPGPMNRGVEISSEVADGAQSLIQRAGRDGRRGAHGGARGAGQQPAEPMMSVMRSCPPPTRSWLLPSSDFFDAQVGNVGASGGSGRCRRSSLADARLVDPASGRDERGSVLVRDGVIADVAWRRGAGGAGRRRGRRLRRPRRSRRASSTCAPSSASRAPSIARR